MGEATKMYEKIAIAIANNLLNHKIIPGEKYHIFKYGCELIISNIIYTLFFLIICLVTDSVIPSLLFFIGFLITRKFCGGFHASTYVRCHLLFAANQLIFIVFNRFFPLNFYLPTLVIFGGLCIVAIILLAPVDHINKPFTKGEYLYYRNCSLILSGILLFGLIVSAFVVKVLPYSMSILFGVFSATVSMLVAKYQRRTSPKYIESNRKEEKCNEETRI